MSNENRIRILYTISKKLISHIFKSILISVIICFDNVSY